MTRAPHTPECWNIRSIGAFWLLLLLGGYLGGENSVGGFSPMRRRLPISNTEQIRMLHLINRNCRPIR